LGELYLFDSKLHGKYSDQEAIKCFNEAKFFLQGKDCPSKLELANTLCNIASYEEESVLSQWNALSNYEKALEIYKRYEGSQSIDYANTLILMANLYSENFGQFETAKSLYYEAILIANRDDNIVSRRLIIGLLRLADGLYSRGRTQEAQEVFRTTYALCRKNLAPNSELYRKTIEQFANFETGAGNLSAGLALFEEYDRAMKQHRANVPIGNYREIAIVYALNGKYIQAEAICRREIDGITAGNYVTEKMLAAATLAFIQNRQGNYKLALSSLQRAYSGRLDKYHLVASYLLQQSIANICLANYEESYRILKRAGNAQFVVASTRNQSKFLIDVYLELVKQIRADRYDLQEFLNIELKYRKAHPKDFGTASFFIKQTDFKAPYSLKEYGQIYFLMHRQLFYQVLEKVGVQQKLGL
jgi:tetratricopeptide (TPR) repeat protein